MMSPQKANRIPKKNFTIFLTFFFLTLGILAVVFFLIIYQNPYVMLNPFPPAYPTYAINNNQVVEAIAKTLAVLPATAAPSNTISPSATITNPTPTQIRESPTPFPTNTQQIKTQTPDPRWIGITHHVSTVHPDRIFFTATPLPKTGYLYSYIMVHEAYLKESPYNDNVSNPLLNCNWIGVAGQVFDITGNPVDGIIVSLKGSIDGAEIKQDNVRSGDSDLLGEGGGFEFKLSDKPFASRNALWLQLFDENGNILSAKAHFSTTVHCTQNLIQIDFIRVK